MTSFLKRLVADTSGSSAVEYGLITALIVSAVLAGMLTLGSDVGGLYNFISAHASGALGA